MDILIQFWIVGVVLAVIVFVFMMFTPLGKEMGRAGLWDPSDPKGEGLIWLFWIAVFLLTSFLFWYFRS